MAFLRQFFLRARVRKILKSSRQHDAIDQLEELLREVDGSVASAHRWIDSMIGPATLHGIVLTAALSRVSREAASPPLDRLVSRPFDAWGGAKKSAVTALWEVARGEIESSGGEDPPETDPLTPRLLERLSSHQLHWLLPAALARSSDAELHWLLPAVDPRAAVEAMAELVTSAHLENRPTGELVNSAARLARQLWDEEYWDVATDLDDEAVRIFTVAALADRDPLVESAGEWLKPLADELPGWIPPPDAARIQLKGHSFTPTGAKVVPSVPTRVIRAALLMELFPHTNWILPLKYAWLGLDDLVRMDAHESVSHSPSLLLAASTVLAALGTCSALDSDATRLVPAGDRHKRLHEALAARNEELSALHPQEQELIERFKEGDDLAEEIKAIQSRIHEIQALTTQLYEAIREGMTPASLLRIALADGQRYPIDARQGAAWGLDRIVRGGRMTDEDQTSAQRLIRSALGDEDFDKSELRTRLAERVGEGDARITRVLAAAERYAADHDDDQLAATLAVKAPGMKWAAAIIREVVGTAVLSGVEGRFGEYAVRLPSDGGTLELAHLLGRGLRWMSELADPAESTERNWAVDKICRTLDAELPKIVWFLTLHPLRLMTLERHRNLLGNYSREQAHVEYWWRYTAPEWFPGADPAELGPVHRRYLRLDDRSLPNSMGIYYDLFRHPLLALPTIYHEFLHFGGPEGIPSAGIGNETEVLVREVVFSRFLRARLAPTGEIATLGPGGALRNFENQVREALALSGMGLADRQAYELEDDRVFQQIVRGIVDTYGAALSPDKAEVAVETRIARENRDIERLNETNQRKLEWCPEKEWPLLDTDETRDLSKRFRKILSESYQQDHRLSLTRRNEVLSDPICVRHNQAWHAYRARLQAAKLP